MTAVEKPRAMKALKTYGSQGSQDIFEFRGGSDGELDVSSLKRRGMEVAEQRPQDIKTNGNAKSWSSQDHNASRQPTLPASEERIIRLTGENQRNGLQNPMPPPPLKPALFEQTQYSETTTLPIPSESTPASSLSAQDTHLGSGTAEESRSFEFSDICKPTCTTSPRGRTDEERPSNIVQSVTNSHETSSSYATNSVLESVRAPEQSSSASIISPSRIITAEEGARFVAPPPAVHGSGDNEVSAPSSNLHTVGKSNPVVLLPDYPQSWVDQDELSLPVHKTSRANKTQVHSSKVPKEQETTTGQQADELGSDDITIGIPKEQYQPRPSRSRSGRGIEGIVEPEDYSKKPEAIGKGKRKTKRRKTTAFQELLTKDDDEEDRDEDVTVSISKNLRTDLPKSPKRGDEPAFDADEAQDENPSKALEGSNSTSKPAEPKKQRGRPKKVPKEVREDVHLDEAQLEYGLEDLEPEKVATPAIAKKSLKRGRNSETPMVIAEGHINDDDSNSGTVDDSRGISSKIFDETQGNSTSSRPVEERETSLPPIKAIVPPKTPQKLTPSPRKGPDKHSPISSGKVAYRVGLSKRARIAPLLRIVRK